MSFRFKYLLFLISLFLSVTESYSQCPPLAPLEKCVTILPRGMHYIKGFKVDNDNGHRDRVEYSYVMTKGTVYSINFCGDNPVDSEKVIIKIYDNYRNNVASNKSVAGNAAMIFQCNSSGIYYIEFSFREENSFCLTSILGFKRALADSF
jgi:hypothetical protein